MDNRKKILKEGDEVAHKENITLKLQVIRVIKKKKLMKDGKTKDFVLGILCGWWNDTKYEKETFHTNHLVPWEIAEKGYVSVISYLEQKHNIN